MQQLKIYYKDYVNCQVTGLTPDDKNMLYKKYSLFVKGAIFNPKYKMGMWDGYSHMFSLVGNTYINFIPEIISSLDMSQYELVEEYAPNMAKLPQLNPIDNTFLNCYKWGKEHRLAGQPVEMFDHQVDIVNACFKNARSVIEAATGCHSKGTKILMYDGSWKNVEDIVVGDKIMGDDGTVRNVLSLHRGVDDMYKITPTKTTKPFVVNGGHILPVISHDKRMKDYLKVTNISVKDYLSKSKWYKKTHAIFNNKSQLEFNKNYEYIISPYVMGVYLGDGSTRTNGQIKITTMDNEIVEELNNEANKNNLKLVEHIDKRGSKAKDYTFNLINRSDKNVIKEELKRYELHGKKSIDKFIPDEYLYGSIQTRLEILAGLIDTDGWFDEKRNYMMYGTVSKKLVDNIRFICGSLGLKTYVNIDKNKKYPDNTYYNVSIAGNLGVIPTRVKRKKVVNKTPKRSGYSTFKVEYVGKDNYYGFECDGNHLYIMEDWWIQHNSGKTLVSLALAKEVSKYGRFIIVEPSKDLTLQTAQTFRELGFDCGVCGCGLRELDNQVTICTWQTINSLEKRKKDDDLNNDKRLLSAIELKRLTTGTIGILFDECHTCKAYHIQKICSETFKDVPIRWGLTGTVPKDTTDKMSLLISLGPVVHNLESKELQERGILADCDITCVRLEDNSAFLSYTDEVNYLSGNTERLDFVSSLLSNIVTTKNNTLVLVNRIATGEYLEQRLKDMGCDCIFLDGSIKSTKRFDEYRSINTTNNKILIATVQIASTGLDIPRLFNLVLLDIGKSFVRVIQSIGRGLRLGKDKNHVDVFDIHSTTPHSRKHFNDRLHYYDEKGFKFKVLKVPNWK